MSAHPRSPLVTLTPGRAILTLSAFWCSIGSHAADYSASHLFNATWPAHAKFHNGQTMSMSTLLCLGNLYYLWRSPYRGAASSLETERAGTDEKHREGKVPGKTSLTTAAAALENAKDDVNTAFAFASLYWASMAMSYLYPGTEGFPNHWGQLYLASGTLAVTTLGWALERWRLSSF